jgi:aminopeptidase N
VGDPTINELGTYDVRISTSEGVVIAGPGLSSREGGVWHFHLDQARSFAFLASPEYRVLEGNAGGVPVRSYYLPGYEMAGQAALDTATEAIHLFAGLFGPYPYPELVIAQNGYYGAMEYSAFMTMSTYAYETYDGGSASLLVALTAHEVSHQWWYGAVGNDQVYEPWLDESLAMYSELLFYERLHPELVDWWWQFRVDQWKPGGPVDVTIYDYGDTRTYVHRMYGRAAHFMADLRLTMGDPAFFSFLRDYYASGRGHIVTAYDFFHTVRTHTDADLEPLLDRYFATERY